MLALSLPGFAGLIGLELSPNTRIGSELSGYAKAHTRLKGLFHSDELPRYGITQADVDVIRAQLALTDRDAFILIAAPEELARAGLRFAHERLDMLMRGVPSEVRRAKPDNATEYLRAMPGAARMYPETDLVPIRSASVVYAPAKTRAQLEEAYHGRGISDEFTRIIIDAPERARFDELLERHPAHGQLLAKVFFLYPKEAKTRHGIDIAFDDHFDALVDALVGGRILEDSFVDALVCAEPIERVLERFAPIDTALVEKRVRAIVAQERATNPNASMGALMGVVMREFAGTVSGKDAQRMIRDALGDGN